MCWTFISILLTTSYKYMPPLSTTHILPIWGTLFWVVALWCYYWLNQANTKRARPTPNIISLGHVHMYHNRIFPRRAGHVPEETLWNTVSEGMCPALLLLYMNLTERDKPKRYVVLIPSSYSVNNRHNAEYHRKWRFRRAHFVHLFYYWISKLPTKM